ncbi:MAG: OsmC family protein [Breznakibacter sp.]
MLVISFLLSLTFVACNQTADSRSPTLNDFLKRRLEAIQTLGKTPDDQLQPIKLEARTTAEQRSGVRRIRIRGHQIISDSGYDFAGYSLGPGSPESALTTIASDIADTYLSQAALKGVRIDSLGVSITSRPDSVPPAKRIVYPHNLLYTIYVKSPATDRELEELRQLTEQHSPIFNLVSTKQAINSNIDYKQTPKELVVNPPFQPGLREYLKYKRAALLWRQERPDANSDLGGGRQRNAEPKPDRLHVEVEPVSGARRLHIRYFNLLHDNPTYLAGNDLGPSAHEHQLGVITSCITHITEIQAARLNIVLDSLAVSIEGTLDLRAGRPGFENVPPYLHDIHYTLHVSSPHAYDEIVALRDSVEAVCPIYNLIISEQRIEGRIVRENPELYRVHPQYYNKE